MVQDSSVEELKDLSGPGIAKLKFPPFLNPPNFECYALTNIPELYIAMIEAAANGQNTLRLRALNQQLHHGHVAAVDGIHQLGARPGEVGRRDLLG